MTFQQSSEQRTRPNWLFILAAILFALALAGCESAPADDDADMNQQDADQQTVDVEQVVAEESDAADDASNGPDEAIPQLNIDLALCVGETSLRGRPQHPRLSGNTNPDVARADILGAEAGQVTEWEQQGQHMIPVEFDDSNIGRVAITGISAGETVIFIDYDRTDDSDELSTFRLAYHVTVEDCERDDTEVEIQDDQSDLQPIVHRAWQYNHNLCVGQTQSAGQLQRPDPVSNSDPSVADVYIDVRHEIQITGLSAGETTVVVEFDSYNDQHEIERALAIYVIVVAECTQEEFTARGGDQADTARFYALREWNYSTTICVGETWWAGRPDSPEIVSNSDPDVAHAEVAGDWVYLGVTITGLSPGESAIIVMFDSLNENHEHEIAQLNYFVTVEQCDPSEAEDAEQTQDEYRWSIEHFAEYLPVLELPPLDSHEICVNETLIQAIDYGFYPVVTNSNPGVSYHHLGYDQEEGGFIEIVGVAPGESSYRISYIEFVTMAWTSEEYKARVIRDFWVIVVECPQPQPVVPEAPAQPDAQVPPGR